MAIEGINNKIKGVAKIYMTLETITFRNRDYFNNKNILFKTKELTTVVA